MGQSLVQGPKVILQALELPSRKILMQSKYKQAKQAIPLANENGHDAFIVSENPKIDLPPLLSSTEPNSPNLESGKSIFLVWLLIQCLVLGLLTTLQIFPHFMILFHENEISQFLDFKDLETYQVLDFG